MDRQWTQPSHFPHPSVQEPVIPAKRSEREDWSALSHHERLDVEFYKERVRKLLDYSVRAQAYIRRHGQT